MEKSLCLNSFHWKTRERKWNFLLMKFLLLQKKICSEQTVKMQKLIFLSFPFLISRKRKKGFSSVSFSLTNCSLLLLCDGKKWIVGLAMQVFSDSEGELCFTMPFSTLLWACLREWSGETGLDYKLFRGLTYPLFVCPRKYIYIGCVLFSAWRRGERFYQEPRVQVLYAQVITGIPCFYCFSHTRLFSY